MVGRECTTSMLMGVEVQIYFKVIAREIDLANFCQVTAWHYYINK